MSECNQNHSGDSRTTETYVPLSRGLDEHLERMPGDSLRVFIHLLLNAVYAGPNRGKCATSFGAIATHLGVSYEVARRAAKKLTPRYVIYVPAKNQHGVTVFEILRNKTVPDFAPTKSAASSDEGAATKQRRSNPRSQLKAQGLQARNNVKNKKNKNPLSRSPQTVNGGRDFKAESDASTCQHTPKCSTHFRHICAVIHEAAGLPGRALDGLDGRVLLYALADAKKLTGVSEDEIRCTVAYVVERDGNLSTGGERSAAAAVAKNLPKYRDHVERGMSSETRCETLDFPNSIEGNDGVPDNETSSLAVDEHPKKSRQRDLEDDRFQNFIEQYPKKSRQHEAADELQRIILDAPDPAAEYKKLMDGVERLNRSGTEVKFMPNMRDFIANKRYLDEWETGAEVDEITYPTWEELQRMKEEERTKREGPPCPECGRMGKWPTCPTCGKRGICPECDSFGKVPRCEICGAEGVDLG